MIWICSQGCIWFRSKEYYAYDTWGKKRRSRTFWCTHPRVLRSVLTIKDDCGYYQTSQFQDNGTIREVKRMSLKEIEEMEGAERIDLESLPKSINARVSAYEFKADKRGKMCLFIDLITQDGRALTQKFSAYYKFSTVLKTLGYKSVDELMTMHRWEKVTFNVGHPRLFPVKKVKA